MLFSTKFTIFLIIFSFIFSSCLRVHKIRKENISTYKTEKVSKPSRVDYKILQTVKSKYLDNPKFYFIFIRKYFCNYYKNHHKKKSIKVKNKPYYPVSPLDLGGYNNINSYNNDKIIKDYNFADIIHISTWLTALAAGAVSVYFWYNLAVWDTSNEEKFNINTPYFQQTVLTTTFSLTTLAYSLYNSFRFSDDQKEISLPTEKKFLYEDKCKEEKVANKTVFLKIKEKIISIGKTNENGTLSIRLKSLYTKLNSNTFDDLYILYLHKRKKLSFLTVLLLKLYHIENLVGKGKFYKALHHIREVIYFFSLRNNDDLELFNYYLFSNNLAAVCKNQVGILKSIGSDDSYDKLNSFYDFFYKHCSGQQKCNKKHSLAISTIKNIRKTHISNENMPSKYKINDFKKLHNSMLLLDKIIKYSKENCNYIHPFILLKFKKYLRIHKKAHKLLSKEHIKKQIIVIYMKVKEKINLANALLSKSICKNNQDRKNQVVIIKLNKAIKKLDEADKLINDFCKFKKQKSKIFKQALDKFHEQSLEIRNKRKNLKKNLSKCKRYVK